MAVHIETRGVPGVDGDDAITVVTMDRQERRNALEHQTLAELTAAVEGAAGRETRVLILTGAGGTDVPDGEELGCVLMALIGRHADD